VIRQESWQLYDPDQTIAQAFSNMYNAYDVTTSPKPVFFPTDANYSASTIPSQAPYTVNLRLFYNPLAWGRTGTPRYIRFDNCIVEFVATPDLENWDNVAVPESTGVIYLVGGLGYEDNNTTILHGYASNGTTPIAAQATLENFIHMDGYSIYNNPSSHSAPISPLHSTDGYTFRDITYTFQPNLEVLFNKQLVTLGCEPSIAFNRSFINNIVASDVGLKTAQLTSLVNGTNGNTFPDTAAAEQCMQNAIATLRSNMTVAGVAAFQATTTICLNTLQNDTSSAVNSLIGVGVDPCSSTFTLTPAVQFTSLPVVVSVALNETNGMSLTNNLPISVSDSIAAQLRGYVTFGTISDFTYDGYQFFNADINSPISGNGSVMISFDNNLLCTNTFSADGTTEPTHTLQSQNYEFIYTPSSNLPGEEDTSIGVPRRDAGDVARDGS